MHRMFKVASSLQAAKHILNSPVTSPLARPAKFLSLLPVCISPLQHELRAVININAEARDYAKFVTLYRRLQGDNFFKREAKLSEREWLAIKLVIERAYHKYGIRSLSVDDAAETIAVVTNPETWISDAVEKNGDSLEEALITVFKHMVPNVPCFNVEDLVRMVSMTPALASEVNKTTIDEAAKIESSIKPK